uniref:Molybdopterin biosynthesis protein n=1 Tax=Gracilariopsis tenuifrons TaxID=31472 RepID=A0A345AI95_9FLOR|nr:molybdopterin biosynthesis protein [Gracilariopsis tenuifrons]AXF36131.1 molybdopterin biosynthesis protein [Gracilariopsis tenuifrons]UAD89345.1 molybdopterin biosynthesis protein [Gracilariopsis tenuifrons]
MSNLEYKKYARHIVLDNIGISGQKRLKTAKILFIGAGGLAASSILYLASSGIGYLGIIDSDQVSYSNLHRQILYNDKDVNKLKVNVVFDKIKEINADCFISVYPYVLNEDNSEDIIKNYDIVIDTSDNFKTRYIISQACYLQHKVHIYAAVQGFEGQVSVFNYKSGILYSDLYPENLQLQNRNCNNLGILGILTGIIGILQATEAIKIILGLGKILNGYLLIYNALNSSFKKIKIKPKQIKYIPNNYYINELKGSNIITSKNLFSIMDKWSVILLDVRQPEEFYDQHLYKAINIPLKNISSKTTIKFIRDYLAHRNIIIYCYDNLRSIIASKILYKNQLNHYRLDY